MKKPIVIVSGEAARKVCKPQKLERQAEAVKKARKELKKAGYRF